MNKKIFCIIGETGSGKSTILDLIMTHDKENKKKYKKLIYNTTRPRRDNEKEGEDYYFTTNNIFYYKTNIDDIVEYRIYDTKNNGRVIYYTTKASFGNVNDDTPLFCAPSPEQVVKFIKYAKEINADIYCIRITTNVKERVLHLINRCKNDVEILEAIRRINDEAEEFSKNISDIESKATKFINIENNYNTDISEFLQFISKCISEE